MLTVKEPTTPPRKLQEGKGMRSQESKPAITSKLETQKGRRQASKWQRSTQQESKSKEGNCKARMLLGRQERKLANCEKCM